MDKNMDRCGLRKGPYRGDVSALCLISFPPPDRRRLLLAGTGQHVLLYDILTGRLLRTFDAFDGVRVHGICCAQAVKEEMHTTNSKGETRLCTVLVHGERRVKVFEMVCLQSGEEIQLKLWQSLPRFNHWVMDVRLLLSNQAKIHVPQTDDLEDGMVLAVGLSNNTICLWDLSNSVFLYRVACSERLLLYSMRLWGDSPESLHAAVGTIFNEVLIWKLGSIIARVEDASRRLTLLKREAEGGERVLGEIMKVRQGEPMSPFEEVVEPLQRLLGHEGSIYRLTWSTDGLTLVSVSDDRSARVWHSGCSEQPSYEKWVAPVMVGPVLYGHGARLWDSYAGEKLLITASEDCTCRVWTTDGKCLATLKGHQGRGIWRCVYDPVLNIVVTAGADSSIKIHSLYKWSKGVEDGVFDRHIDSVERVSQSTQEVLNIEPVWADASTTRSGYLDSKSEYVRCLKLSGECSLYVGTNQGYVYHVKIALNQEPVWSSLVRGVGPPVVCMDVLVLRKRTEDLREIGSHPNEDLIVVGDGKGSATAIRVRAEAQEQCSWRYTWVAEKERQLLEVFWCRPLEGRYVFTADPKGSLLAWRLPLGNIDHGNSAKNSSGSSTTGDRKVALDETEKSAVLVAMGKSAYGRVVCMDVCLDQQLLVCGDKQGSLTVFSFPRILLDRAGDVGEDLRNPIDGPFQLQIVAVLRGAHGISTVTSVSFVAKQHGGQVEIRTTGRDGCVCKFHLEDHVAATKIPPLVTCTGIERVNGVSMIEGLEHSRVASPWTNSERKVAVGFTGSDFLLWDMTYNSELLRVTCGGWRRPFSYIVGIMPGIQHAFVFVKGQAIQIHRNWVNPSEAASSKAESDAATKSLRAQFHGREINSVLIFASPTSTGFETASSQSVMVATGAEDGTVILSSYLEGMQEKLDPNVVLGDHVGGSAVRSLSLVNKVYSLDTPSDASQDLTVKNDPSSGVAGRNYDSGHFLFSAGAKEVLTCWWIDWNTKYLDSQRSCTGNEITGQLSPSADEKLDGPTTPKSFGVSSQWLSTRMPQRKHPPSASLGRQNDLVESATMSGLVRRLNIEEEDLKDKRTTTSKTDDDDHRYLAMTAFAVTCTRTRTLVCFIVTASSNATLTVHAFHTATRSWIEVAFLDYQDAPVLSIEHIVAPCPPVSGCGNTYLVFTGATNGNIALWDITTMVVQYMNSGDFGVKAALPSVLRPLTGRGSQGGRRRKNREELKLDKESKTKTAKAEKDNLRSDSVRVATRSVGHMKPSVIINSCHHRDSLDRQSAVQEQSHDTKVVLEQLSATPVVSLMQEIEAAHQSGVNCMSVAKLQWSAEAYAESAETVYVVISGGDDQAIHLTAVKLVPQTCPLTIQTAEDFQGENKQQNSEDGMPLLKLLSRREIPYAHSSAVKGIWTDGSWVFSTGLDQRLRCWKISTHFCKETMNLGDSTVDGTKGPEFLLSLVECVTCVIDTPEAAALHVNTSSQGKYHIAVVGRGLQVINFDSTMISQPSTHVKSQQL